MQPLGKDLALRLSAIYNRGTTSSTSQILGKCAVYAVGMGFQFPISVVVNLLHFLMIDGATFLSVRVMNGCAVRWHPFSCTELTRWSDALSRHKLIDEGT